MANIEIIGKIKPIKDTEKFHPFEEKEFESGWQAIKCRFNVISGNNRFQCEISGGKWKNDSKNKIYSFSKAANGKKSEKIEIEWNKRRDAATIANVAGWKIYTVDLMTFDERKQIEDNGTSEEKAAAAKKRYQFIEKTDMAYLMQKILQSGKYENSLFKIVGNVDYQYSEAKNEWYRTLTVNKIYRVADNTEPKAEMTLSAYYTADAMNADNYEDTKKYLFNCYTDYYFSNVKDNRFVPLALVIDGNGDEKTEKRAEGFKKKLTTFEDDAVVRKCDLVCTMIDGAQERAITLDDLDEETRENIELGLIDEKEALRALGGNVFGDRITETRIKSLAKTSVKGSEATVYTLEDLNRLPVVEDKPNIPDVTADDDDDFDIFGDEV